MEETFTPQSRPRSLSRPHTRRHAGSRIVTRQSEITKCRLEEGKITNRITEAHGSRPAFPITFYWTFCSMPDYLPRLTHRLVESIP